LIRNELDIMFVVSPANAHSIHMPFYYLYLSGYLDKHGIISEILDPHENTIEENITIIIEQIKKRRPRFVGLASFVTDYHVVKSLAELIKKHSDATVVVGNAHPSVCPQDFIYDNSPFDIVVLGEGELTLKQVIEEYNANMDNSNINGICYKEEGIFKKNAKREFMDMSNCGFPAYHKLNMKWYSRPTKWYIRNLATTSCAGIYTGRGCPFNCGFCASNVVWQANDKSNAAVIRRRPVEAVIEELSILRHQYHFDFFYIHDDTFGIKENDIFEFCEAYQKSGLKMLWGTESRVNCIQKKEVVTTLKAAGCVQLDFGVETGSPKLLKIANKGINVEQTITAFELCKAQGIRTFANILLNLPEENTEDLTLSHSLIVRIKPTYVSVGVTQPYPGTDFCVKYFKPIAAEDYNLFNCVDPEEKYRMAEHQIDLAQLLLSWQLRYNAFSFLEKALFMSDFKYWKLILSSMQKWSFAVYCLKDQILMPLRRLKYWLLYVKKYHTYKLL